MEKLEKFKSCCSGGGGGGYLLRAVLGGEQPVLLCEHQPLPLAGHLGRARVTCHVAHQH